MNRPNTCANLIKAINSLLSVAPYLYLSVSKVIENT